VRGVLLFVGFGTPPSRLISCAPSIDMMIGECVAITNWKESVATRKSIILTNSTCAIGDSAASGSSKK
jgi:hypothetical protein